MTVHHATSVRQQIPKLFTPLAQRESARLSSEMSPVRSRQGAPFLYFRLVVQDNGLSRRRSRVQIPHRVPVFMVAVAQLAEPRIVIPAVVGSSPIRHPIFIAM